MRVRIICPQGYESVKVKAAPGDVVEVGDVTGGKLIAGGTAVHVEPVIETAAAAAPETTAKRTGKAARRTPKAGARRGSFSAKE